MGFCLHSMNTCDLWLWIWIPLQISVWLIGAFCVQSSTDPQTGYSISVWFSVGMLNCGYLCTTWDTSTKWTDFNGGGHLHSTESNKNIHWSKLCRKQYVPIQMKWLKGLPQFISRVNLLQFSEIQIMLLSFGNAFVSQKHFGTPKGNKYLNKKAISVIWVNNLMYIGAK